MEIAIKNLEEVSGIVWLVMSHRATQSRKAGLLLQLDSNGLAQGSFQFGNSVSTVSAGCKTDRVIRSRGWARLWCGILPEGQA